MLLNAYLILVFAAFVLTLLGALTPPRAPLWVAVLLLTVALMVQGFR